MLEPRASKESMNKPELTVWFSAAESPSRIGVYQRRYQWGISFAYFDGKRWGLSAASPEQAVVSRPRENTWSAERLPWRGLTSMAHYPQLRDDAPDRTGRHCPLDKTSEDDDG